MYQGSRPTTFVESAERELIMKKPIIMILLLVFFVFLAGCTSKQPSDQDSQDIKDAEPLPADWLAYPESETLYHMPHAYEMDYQNLKIESESWTLLAPEDVEPGYEGWIKITEYYDDLALKRDDFDKDEFAEGFYMWDECLVQIDGYTSSEDETRFEIWLRIEHVDTIDPS